MNQVRVCVFGCTKRDGTLREAAPGRMCCDRCAEKLMQVLGDLADRYATLQTADELIPGGHGDNGGGRKAPGPRSPAVDALLIHSDIRTRWTSEHGYGALAVVESWARMIREETSLDTPPRQMLGTVPEGRATMSRELRTIRFHWDYVLRSAWLDDFARDMRDVLHSLTHAGRLTERWIQVGPCPMFVAFDDAAVTGEPIYRECGATLRVRADDDTLTCRACGSSWPRSQWWRLGDEWTDYAFLSAELDVPAATLRGWCLEDGWRKRPSPTSKKRVLVCRVDALKSYAERRAGKVVA
ncbi:hypothetical protein [Amycolatopsis pigmentata]|uniref:Uncharacterized protein n=1 Tax=Amycolatopsis pigmentata TaxID=450801 RepID=A0ABW5G3R4_9PSEU